MPSEGKAGSFRNAPYAVVIDNNVTSPEPSTIEGTAGGGLVTVHGDAADALPRLAVQLGVQAVFASHDDDEDRLFELATQLKSTETRELAFVVAQALDQRSDVVVRAPQPDVGSEHGPHDVGGQRGAHACRVATQEVVLEGLDGILGNPAVLEVAEARGDPVDHAILGQELAKFALYLDAAPGRPQPLDGPVRHADGSRPPGGDRGRPRRRPARRRPPP